MVQSTVKLTKNVLKQYLNGQMSQISVFLYILNTQRDKGEFGEEGEIRDKEKINKNQFNCSTHNTNSFHEIRVEMFTQSNIFSTRENIQKSKLQPSKGFISCVLSRSVLRRGGGDPRAPYTISQSKIYEDLNQ